MKIAWMVLATISIIWSSVEMIRGDKEAAFFAVMIATYAKASLAAEKWDR